MSIVRPPDWATGASVPAAGSWPTVLPRPLHWPDDRPRLGLLLIVIACSFLLVGAPEFYLPPKLGGQAGLEELLLVPYGFTALTLGFLGVLVCGLVGVMLIEECFRRFGRPLTDVQKRRDLRRNRVIGGILGGLAALLPLRGVIAGRFGDIAADAAVVVGLLAFEALLSGVLLLLVGEWKQRLGLRVFSRAPVA